MKRLLLGFVITLALVVGSFPAVAQDICGLCIQQAIVEQNMAFNQCRDNDGCQGVNCENCVGAGISAKYDYVNSSCPTCGDMLITRLRKKARKALRRCNDCSPATVLLLRRLAGEN